MEFYFDLVDEYKEVTEAFDEDETLLNEEEEVMDLTQLSNEELLASKNRPRRK